MADDGTGLREVWRRWRHLVPPFLVAVLPLLVLLFGGVVWLIHHDGLLIWLLALMVGGYAAMKMLPGANRRLEADLPGQDPDPAWPPIAAGAWEKVAAKADTLTITDWPDSARGFYDLARDTLAEVARHAHPDARQPLAEVSLPHALLVIEAASHDLRTEVLAVVPFAHKVRLADFERVQSLGSILSNLNDLYRAGRFAAFPIQAIAAEAASTARSQAFEMTREALQVWLMRQWVRKVGFHAVALYCGHTVLSAPKGGPTADSMRDLRRAAEAAADDEPLRLLVMGRSGAGKSSLVNALFGEELAATDVLADTTPGLTPFVLERDGWPAALVLDSPGCDSDSFGVAEVFAEAARSDALLFVTPATRPDRAGERAMLDELRASKLAHERGLPPLFVVLSQADRLPPARAWAPPYDLGSEDPKAVSIAGAVRAAATDLGVPVERVIPACLASGRVYNVEDTLLNLLAAEMDGLRQARLRRCLAEHRRKENWALVLEQLRAAGRFLQARLGD